MFKQKAILEFDQSTSDLFVRKSEGKLSLDTFFNSFNLYPIKKYTNGTKLTIKMAGKGECKVEIIHQKGEEKELLFESDKFVTSIEIDIEKISEIGIIFPVFSGNFELLSLSYEVNSSERKASAFAIFTTFNRQEYLFSNLKKLNSCENIDKVIIVDNAKNVVLPHELPKDKFILVPNENLGGTGGFTRGMMEAKKHGATHVFIMDDDITLIPEVEDKAISLISSLKEECKDNWIGFSMLSKERPTYQFELGAKWKGVPLRKNATWLDVSKVENIMKNQVISEYNYSGWWSLIMPVEVLDKYGYPFPFFIKFDDVEFALRRDHEEIILTNGFGVWHQDFGNKEAGWLNYYQYRNGLVTNALHDKKPVFHSLVGFLGKNIKCYFKGRFNELNLIDLAINDYLKGPDYFYDLDIVGRNNEIREMAKQKVGKFKGIFLLPFKQLHYFNKVLFRFNKAKKIYKKDVGKVTNEEYWRKVFNHD